MAGFLKSIRLPLFAGAILLFFINERYLSFENYYDILKYISIFLLGISALSALVISAKVNALGLKEEAKSYKYAFMWQLAVFLSPIVYLVYRGSLGPNELPELFVQKALLSSWLLLFILGTFVGIGMEVVLSKNGTGKLAESHRVVKSGGFWLLIGLALGVLTSLNYVGVANNKTYDLSYFKITKPSEATEKLLPNLEKDFQITLFYPENNEVKQFLSEYFEKVQSLDPKVLKIKYFDKETSPITAEEMKVDKNGVTILEYNGRKETISISTKLEKARNKLKKLDKLFHKTFLKLTSKKKMAYFTRGHGELDWISSKLQPFKGINGFKSILQSQNYEVNKLASAEGSLTGIPDDAAVVVIVGPTEPFLEQEVEYLKQYMEKGGSLAVYLDIDKVSSNEENILKKDSTKRPLIEFLAGAGLNYHKELLVNEKNHSIYTRTKVDRSFLYTNGFSGRHDSVATLYKFDDRLHVSTYNSGYLTFKKDPASKWRHYESIKTLNSTFADKNKNYKFDKKDEKQDQYLISIASSFQKNRKAHFTGDDTRLVTGKLILTADATSVSDGLLQNNGNQYMIVDQFKWLVGDTKTIGSGIAETEEDVKLNHSRSKGLFVFHGSIFSIPLLILFLGFFANRSSRRKRKEV